MPILYKGMPRLTKNFHSRMVRVTDADLQIYDVYRKYIQHQDELVNKRLDRLFAVHAALVAIAGLSITKDGPFGRFQGPTLIVFSVFGISFCFAQRTAIKAGLDATRKLNDKWNKCISPKIDTNLFPGLVGGGNEENAQIGRAMTLRAPWLLALIWGTIACTGFLLTVSELPLILSCQPKYWWIIGLCVIGLVALGIVLRHLDNKDARAAFPVRWSSPH